MEIALIGLPQSGKTTLLNALTRGRTQAGPHGGDKHEISVGSARMSDPRLDTLAEIFGPDKLVPVEIKYWDVPVAPDSTGDGPGISGPTLNLLQNADALLVVVRAFEDPSVPHVAGSVDPHRDVAITLSDLALSDLAVLERRVERIADGLKGAKVQERETLLREGPILGRIKEGLEGGVPLREQQVYPEEVDFLANYQLLTGKPLLVVLNTGEEDLPKAEDLEQDLASRYLRPGMNATSLCSKLEMELVQLSPDDEREFRESIGIQESGLDRLVRLSYELLSLVSFFTYVSKEVRAWTVPAETAAVKAAGKIHSDMERGFIRAEVVSFHDLSACGSLAQCKKQGRLRLEGKSYPVQDGDVITFLFNV